MGVSDYQVRLYDPAGALVAEFVRRNLLGLELTRVVNGVATLELTLGADDSRVDLFEEDGQLEVWRQPPGEAWYKEWEGFVGKRRFDKDDESRDVLIVSGRGYVDLLDRRIIAAAAGSAGAEKSGVAETVLKAFVDEQIVSATDADRQISGLTIEADGAGGNTVSIANAYSRLLEVCQKIAKTGGGDFDIVGTGAAAWELRWYDGQRGTDHTKTTGTDPVTFSTAYKNMAEPRLTVQPAGATAVLVAGGGQGAARTLVWRPATLPTGLSRRELFRDARDATATATLQARGDAALYDNRARNVLTFTVLQTPTYAYGVHYTLGDLVTAFYRDVEVDLKIVKVRLRLGEPEEIDVEFEDV